MDFFFPVELKPKDAAATTHDAAAAPAKDQVKDYVIEGVPALGWGQGKECTFAGALEAATSVTPHPLQYADIMGVSGLAFRVRWYLGVDGQRWCPSSAVGEFPEEIQAVSRATGWRLSFGQKMDSRQPKGPCVQQFMHDVLASLHAGMPVLAYPTRDNFNLAVIYGSEDGELLVHAYCRDQARRAKAAEIGHLVIFLQHRAEALSPREALLQALTTDNWRAVKRDAQPARGSGCYWYGDSALGYWMDALGLEDTSPQERDLLFRVNFWVFGILYDARQAAVTYLTAHAGLFEGDAREALLRAAETYRQVTDVMAMVFQQKDAFLGPWTGKGIGDWTPDVRRKEQEILGQLRPLEAHAREQIDRAVEAIQAA